MDSDASFQAIDMKAMDRYRAASPPPPSLVLYDSSGNAMGDESWASHDARLHAAGLLTLGEIAARAKLFRLNAFKHLKAFVFIASSVFNAAVLINNYASRPARDSSIPYNLATLIVVYYEFISLVAFAGYVLLSACAAAAGAQMFRGWPTARFGHLMCAALSFSLFASFLQTQGLIALTNTQLRNARKQSGVKAVAGYALWVYLLLLTVGLTALAAVAVVLKLAQLQFVATPFDAWSTTQMLTLLGFLNNIAFVSRTRSADSVLGVLDATDIPAAAATTPKAGDPPVVVGSVSNTFLSAIEQIVAGAQGTAPLSEWGKFATLVTADNDFYMFCVLRHPNIDVLL